MINPDVIVCWPNNCDYPLWRDQIRKHRSRFNEIIIVFTETNGAVNYEDFVRQAMFEDHVLFVSSPIVNGNQDWRNVATNAALLQSYNAPYIWFTEQDFLFNETFWDTIDQLPDPDFIGVDDNGRWHPCSMLIKRELLNGTSKNFGIVPDKSDHFGIIQKELTWLRDTTAGLKYYLFDVNTHTEMFKHFNGYSHNWRLITEGQQPNYQPEEFKTSLQNSLDVSVPLDPRWVKTACGCL